MDDESDRVNPGPCHGNCELGMYITSHIMYALMSRRRYGDDFPRPRFLVACSTQSSSGRLLIRCTPLPALSFSSASTQVSQRHAHYLWENLTSLTDARLHTHLQCSLSSMQAHTRRASQKAFPPISSLLQTQEMLSVV